MPTYTQLEQWLAKLSPEQKKTDVTIYLLGQDETFGIRCFEVANETSNCDALDNGHPYLVIDANFTNEEYITHDECLESDNHLRSVDRDGYCNRCGEQ
jgi:hypothetical protein